MKRKVVAIVPAAGTGKRFGSSVKKTFIALDGTPLLVRTLRRLEEEKAVDEIIPVMGQEDIEEGYRLFQEQGLSKIKVIAPGGKERQDSINNALKVIDVECIVLIHDGVRPIIPGGTIDALLAGLEKADGVIPGIPVKETLKEVREDGQVTETLNRECIRAIQTPQAFSLKVIRKAYDMAYRDGFQATDDAALVEKMGGTVKVIPGSSLNIKVTIPEDLEMVEFILRKHAL